MIKGIEGNLSVWLRLLKAQFESLGMCSRITITKTVLFCAEMNENLFSITDSHKYNMNF